MRQNIKPQPGNLQLPDSGAFLWKIIPANYFIDEFKNSYLYFRRVDQYNDFKDSALPAKVRKKLEKMVYEKGPNFNEAIRYDRQRLRTYACCFSTKDTPYIWEEYGGAQNAICIVFDCFKLVDSLEETVQDSRIILNNSRRKVSFFHLNYGLVNYIEHEDYDFDPTNPISCVYLKDLDLNKDSEFRVTLSAEGLYEKCLLEDGIEFEFPNSIQFEFNFQQANAKNIIHSIVLKNKVDKQFLDEIESLLGKVNFVYT